MEPISAHMNIEYKKHINTYDPIAVGWTHENKNVLLEFSELITAVFSAKLNRVIIALYSENKLFFYYLNGELELSARLPTIDLYQYRGINKNLESKTGVSFLFHPVADSVGNKWRDAEQYELDIKCSDFLGKKLGIYR